mmetsp:Transcript_99226/g.286303  ORF Transcript_99226/g.286303 Transcript_99226/m.286303 type:complete len:280 (-) Transcript_99226:1483-2322(-)
MKGSKLKNTVTKRDHPRTLRTRRSTTEAVSCGHSEAKRVSPKATEARTTAKGSKVASPWATSSTRCAATAAASRNAAGDGEAWMNSKKTHRNRGSRGAAAWRAAALAGSMAAAGATWRSPLWVVDGTPAAAAAPTAGSASFLDRGNATAGSSATCSGVPGRFGRWRTPRFLSNGAACRASEVGGTGECAGEAPESAVGKAWAVAAEEPGAAIGGASSSGASESMMRMRSLGCAKVDASADNIASSSKSSRRTTSHADPRNSFSCLASSTSAKASCMSNS